MVLFIMAMLLAQTPARRVVQTGTVTGQLLRVDGTPAVGVLVAVTPVPVSGGLTGDLLSLAQTDRSGNYRLEDIRPGRYYIQAGPPDSLNFYPGTTSLDKASVVNVAAGEVVHVEVFRMGRPPGVRISGRLPSDPSSQRTVAIGPASAPPMLFSGVTLQGFAYNGISFGNNLLVPNVGNAVVVRTVVGTPDSATVRDDGTFEIFSVKPGTYTVVAFPVASPLQATVTVEDHDIEIKFPDDPGMKVSGVLGMTESSRGANARLSLIGPIWGRLDTVTDSNGAFEFPNVPPGKYTVRSSENLALSTITVGDRELSGVVVPSTVVISGEILVEDELEPNAAPPTLTAKRTDGMQMTLPIPRGPSTVFAKSGTETVFKMPLTEGEFRLTFSNVVSPFYVKSMVSGSTDLLKDPLTVTSSSNEPIHVTIGKHP